jgi:hypothetical protein
LSFITSSEKIQVHKPCLPSKIVNSLKAESDILRSPSNSTYKRVSEILGNLSGE